MSIQTKQNALLPLLGFILVLIIGLVPRLSPLELWTAYPEETHVDNEVMINSMDGYFYLALARDLATGTYYPQHETRAVPEKLSRPMPPPLLSYATAKTSNWFGISLELVAVFLPVFFGIMLALPIYGLGKFYGGHFMGFSSALICMTSTYYMARTSLGWYDTDCLLVPLALAACYFSACLVTAKEENRYKFIFLCTTMSLLMLWAWDQAPGAAIIISFFPLLSVFILYHKQLRDLHWLLLISIVCVCSLLIFSQGFANILSVFWNALIQLGYILQLSSASESLFPDVASFVQEQAGYSFLHAVHFTSGHLLVFLLAITGLILLFAEQWRKASIILAPVLLTVLAFAFANRFLIYATPVLAIGLAYLLTRLRQFKTSQPILTYAVPILLVLLVFPAYLQSFTYRMLPTLDSAIAEGMVKLKYLTPRESVIWAHWDYGYPLIFYGERATIADGGFHNAKQMVYSNFPLATEDPRLAANFIQFFVHRGVAGMSRFYHSAGLSEIEGHKNLMHILSVGPQEAEVFLRNLGLSSSDSGEEDWLDFFYPLQAKTVFLFLDFHLTTNVRSWYKMGTWNIEQQQGSTSYYWAFNDIQKQDGVLTHKDDFSFNPETGELFYEERNIPVSNFLSVSKESITRSRTWSEDGVVVEYFPKKNRLTFASKDVASSLFHRLFIRDDIDTGYFIKKIGGEPDYQIWQVNADKNIPE